MSDTEFSDEMLMAFADRELDPATAREIARRRETDPELDARIRVFEQTAGLARRALDPIAHEPVPFRLLAAAQGASRGANGAANQSANPGDKPGAQQDTRRGGGRLTVSRELMAMAASVLLVVGIGAGFLASVWPGSETPGGLAALDACGGAGLSRTLETAASGEQRVDGGCAVVPVASYRDEAGAVCRAFQAASGGGKSGPEAVAGIACRDEGGDWRTRVAVDLTPRQATGDAYRPASGAGVGLDTLRAAAGLKAAPLSPDDERELLHNAWQSAR